MEEARVNNRNGGKRRVCRMRGFLGSLIKEGLCGSCDENPVDERKDICHRCQLEGDNDPGLQCDKCEVLTITLCLESAPYRVISNSETYEERIYPAQKWVTTSHLSVSHNEAANDMFHHLFNYIDGQNDAGIKVDMTAPVTVLVRPGEGPNCENNFTESFYVPAVHQDAPPTPNDVNVYIEERSELHVFSRRFHGFARDEDWIYNADALLQDLLAAGVENINFQNYYTAGYDSPYVIFNRTNEVWILKN